MSDVDVSEKYIQFQIASSENLRLGGEPGLSKEQRLGYFNEAKKWATKAFLSANQNVYARALAFSQYQCANGLILLAENDFNSIVVSDSPPEDVNRF